MWTAGGRLSSGRYDEALRIDVLGQEGLALGVSGCRRQVLEEGSSTLEMELTLSSGEG